MHIYQQPSKQQGILISHPYFRLTTSMFIVQWVSQQLSLLPPPLWGRFCGGR